MIYGAFASDSIVYGRLDGDTVRRWHIVLAPGRLADGRELAEVSGCMIVPMPCDDIPLPCDWKEASDGVLLTKGR